MTRGELQAHLRCAQISLSLCKAVFITFCKRDKIVYNDRSLALDKIVQFVID